MIYPVLGKVISCNLGLGVLIDGVLTAFGIHILGSSAPGTADLIAGNNTDGVVITGARLSAATTVGYSLTATAIDPLSNTSEFCPCREVTEIALYLPVAMRK